MVHVGCEGCSVLAHKFYCSSSLGAADRVPVKAALSLGGQLQGSPARSVPCMPANRLHMVPDASLIALACQAYCGLGCDVVSMCVWLFDCHTITFSVSSWCCVGCSVKSNLCMVETRPHWCIAHMQVFLGRGLCFCCFVSCGIHVSGSQYH